jgi:hypothetical protein
MFNSRTIQGIFVLAIGVILSVWLGLSIVTNQTETIIQVLAALVLIGCLFLERKIWLLIPFASALGITLRLPGQPDSLLLAQILVLGFSTLMLLMRKLPFGIEWSELEFWVFLLILLVAQVYIRNPVSVNIIGGDTVGGKGYAIFLISVTSCLLLAGLRVPVQQLKWVLPLSILGGLANVAISILGTRVAAIGFITGADYTRSDEVNYEKHGIAVDAGAATRIGFAGGLAKNLSLWISSYISPIQACFKPLWALLVLLAVAAALMSGFRNSLIGVGLTFFIGIAYRSGSFGVLLSTFGGFTAIVLLALINVIHPLPPNIQRSLTFLPGTWEERYKEDAKGSTEWRVELWKEALTSDRWIRNKIIGDGLGFSAENLEKSFNITKGSGTFDAHREQILINGDYHSGPVSTIRVIGYIGLLFFLLAQIRLAVHAHRQINRCRGTEWFPLALFTGIPLIAGPFFFVFVFGDFKTAVSGFLLSVGMVRLLENNLPLPHYVVRKREPYVLQRQNATSQSPQQS